MSQAEAEYLVNSEVVKILGVSLEKGRFSFAL